MTDRPRYETLLRSVPVQEVQFSRGELEAIFVPWNTPARVYEGSEVYDEGFRRGAFDAQLQRQGFTPATIPLLPRHNSTETFGHARKLTDVEQGLHGVVAVRPSLRADVEEMVEDGIDSVSIEFHPLQARPRSWPGDPVRWRDRAVLVAVALTPSPVYEGAKVLALRSDDELAALERRARLQDLERDIQTLKESPWAK